MIFTSFINVYLSVITLANFILAFSLYFKSPKAKINIFYSLTVLSATIWTFCMVMLRTLAQDTTVSLYLWSTLLWVATIPIVLFYLYFCMEFPEELSSERKRWSIRLVLLIPALLVLFINILYFGTFKEVFVVDGGVGYKLNLPHFYIWALYIIGYFSVAFIILFRKLKKAQGIIRVQLAYVIYGTLPAASFGVIFGIIFPLFDSYRYFWLSEGTTIIMSVFITYAIVKHHLMDIKVIATEILSVSIALILLIDALLAETVIEFIWKFGLFAGIAVFSVLLIRGVLNEIETRQKIAKLAITLRRMNVKLKKLDKTKSEFISLASHQLRTPLSIIKGYISMILEGMWGKVGQEQKKRLEQVYSSNERLIKLVEDLLTVSRIESGRLKFDFQMLPLGKLTQDIVKDFSQIAADKGLYLKYIKSEKPLPRVKADSLKIRQVIQNLIDNAIHYTKKGGVVIRLKAEKNKVIFSIQDTGIGVSRKEQMKLFEKFSRGADVAKMYTEGTGLGLYLAAKLIETHQGRIWVESEGKNKGSTFYFELPIK